MLVTFLADINTVAAQNNDAEPINKDGITRWEPSCSDGINMPDDVREWNLRLGGSAGYGSFRDMGTAPISFHGATLQSHISVRYEPGKRQYHLDVNTAVGYFEDKLKPKFNFTTFDINNSIRIKVLQRIDAHILTQEWVGIGLANFIDVTVNTNYENASTGVSEFLGPELYIKGLQLLGQSRWSLYGEVGVMPVAALLRPGYSYIDNYTAAQPVLDAVFDDYQWHTKFFAAISTEIGVLFSLRNNNKLGLAYRWEYHSSGNSGIWRFDHVLHSLQVNIIFNLKRAMGYEKDKI